MMRPSDAAFSPARLFALFVGLVVALIVLYAASDVVFLAFAGVLLAILLRSIGDLVARVTPLGRGWSLAVGTIGLLLLLSAAIWFSAASVVAQVDELVRQVPEGIATLRAKIEKYEWSRQLLDEAPSAGESLGRRRLWEGAQGVFSTTMGAISGLVVVLFVGLYLAASPDVYRRGLVRLVPLDRRPRHEALLDELDETLRWWLFGQLVAMAIIGVGTWVGLMLLGVPAALALALLAALLTFIPNFGPILAAIPAVLLALVIGPTTALYVVLLYVGIQAVESYLISPMIQQKTLELPPALTILAQVLLGLLFGGLGLLLATPLTAITLVVVRQLYIEDMLGDRLDVD